VTGRRARVPPVAGAYFHGRRGTTQHPVITAVLSRRWRRHPGRKRVSGSWTRKLRARGVTCVVLPAGGHDAGFSITGLLRRAPWPGRA
jgi:hypothetical protein